MRIFTDIASHDTTGVAPGGRIIRTDSTPEAGATTEINGQFVFPVPEGAALEVDSSSFYFPQENLNSIPSQAAAEFLIRYPMYDHILYNFYLDNEDVGAFDIAAFADFPSLSNTTPVLPTALVAPASARCTLGRASGPGAVGMVPNSLGMLPRSDARAAPVYGCAVTATIDLWEYNPCYIEVIASPAAVGAVISIGGVSLLGFAGARTPGSNNFNATAGSSALIAADVVAAINDGANSFSTFVQASVDPTVPSRVRLKPVPATNTAVTVTTSAAGSYTVVESHPGTDEVMLWWKVSGSSTSEDLGFSNKGTSAGQNSPAIKTLTETDPEIAPLLVYASVDNGVSWSLVPYLEPVDLVGAGSDLRVCFINTGTASLYLHGFCVLFPDLLPPL
jgi:hypothetical protein